MITVSLTLVLCCKHKLKKTVNGVTSFCLRFLTQFQVQTLAARWKSWSSHVAPLTIVWAAYSPSLERGSVPGRRPDGVSSHCPSSSAQSSASSGEEAAAKWPQPPSPDSVAEDAEQAACAFFSFAFQWKMKKTNKHRPPFFEKNKSVGPKNRSSFAWKVNVDSFSSVWMAVSCATICERPTGVSDKLDPFGPPLKQLTRVPVFLQRKLEKFQ